MILFNNLQTNYNFNQEYTKKNMYAKCLMEYFSEYV
ncbi:LOW QUALITY PROTEIN: hypothetical protein PanWU01x14_329140 [Parasponia andersonii]|uniref:Uncharacterized protein n=1 Tax=Parasponia andersonii TaxID=3476 RepID=A0A2P5AIJ7_PARAD|nr:LOW QUALITY PROTEIN: hypothetical protein PanWU01x14_329140 [Parasponia andersonii]